MHRWPWSAARTLCFVAVFWERLTGAQGVPAAWVVAASAAAALLIVASPRSWRLSRIAITIAHEGGHALASVLTGRRLEGIRLHADTSGETVSRGRRSGPALVATTLAGYPAPPLLGAGTAWLLAAHRVTLVLSLLLLLLVLTFLAVRNGYGALAVLLAVAGVVAVTWLGTPATRATFAYGVAWFLLFGGVRPIAELARTRDRVRTHGNGRASRRAGMSDADQLTWLTGVPRGVWVAVFALVALASVALGARLLIPWPAHLPAIHGVFGIT